MKRRRRSSGGASSSEAQVQTWVQCSRCSKWRTLAAGVAAWGGDFTCPLNTWAPALASCEAREEGGGGADGAAAASNPSIVLFEDEEGADGAAEGGARAEPPDGAAAVGTTAAGTTTACSRPAQLARLRALVEAHCAHDRTFPLSVLEGHSAGGRVYTDGGGTFAALGSLCGFWAIVGDASAANAAAVARLLRRERGWWSCVLSFPNEAWAPALAAGLGALAAPVPRLFYSTLPQPPPPCTTATTAAVALPPLPAGMVARLLSEDPQRLFSRYRRAYRWHQSTWPSAEAFEAAGGIGCVLLSSKSHRIVAGCVSCFVGGGGHELDIWTAPSHRRKGLAWYCAARALQVVLASAPEARLYANWSCDADKEASRRIGERLGFTLLGQTMTFNEAHDGPSLSS